MATIPAPTVVSREEWPDADFDLPEGVPITTSSDRDDDVEDWDIKMNLGQTGGAKVQVVLTGITTPLSASVSKLQSSPTVTIRPPIVLSENDEDDDEGVSTIKANAIPTGLAKVSPAAPPIEEDFEEAFALPSDLTQLSLAPLSLHHRTSRNSLEWGEKDQTSSSQSSDAYSTFGFADASPSSNSVSSVSTPGTESEEDEDHDELEGLVLPTSIFESGQGGKQLNKILQMKKKAHYTSSQVKIASPDPEDDFEAGLILDDDADLSPSRLLQNSQVQRAQRTFIRSNSAPVQRPPSSSTSLRPPSRLRSERAKSPSNPPPSSVRQLQKLRLSPSPPLRPPSLNQTNFQAFASADPSLSPSPSPSFLVSKPGSLRGQKSHTGLKPPALPAPRKLTRKASLSSLMETSHALASEAAAGSSRPRLARYEVPTAASLAKSHKSSTTRSTEYPVPPTRPHTPSSNAAALRLTMPTQMRTKSRPSLSQVFAAPSASSSSSSTSRAKSPVSLPARPPSSASLRQVSSRISKTAQSLSPPPPSPQTPNAPKVLKKPKRQKTYGDGTELDGIEDLPTDRDKESRYRVQPKGCGNRTPSASYSPKSATSLSAVASDSKGTVRKKKREGSISNDGAIATLAPTTNTLRRTSTRIDSTSKAPTSPPPAEPLPKKKKNGSSPSTQGRRRPTLIRNLGGIGASKVVGDMKWNPHTLRWEGNDQILKDFDAVVATSTRPALITHLTGTSIGSPVGSFASGARRVGNMIFDPQRMCWISALSPDEDEPDVFANLADDEDENDSKGGTIRASAQRAPSEAGSVITQASVSEIDAASPAPSHSRTISDSESDRGSRASLMVCDIDNTFVAACRAAEERHRREIKGWRLALSNQECSSEPDRSYLYEIRALATRRY